MATILPFPPRGPYLEQALRELRRITSIGDVQREVRMREFEAAMVAPIVLESDPTEAA